MKGDLDPLFFFWVFFLTNGLLIWGLAEDKGEPSPSGMRVRWLTGSSTFKAGDKSTMKINILDKAGHDINPFVNGDSAAITLIVNGMEGNSSYVSSVSLSFETKSTSWSITFVPLVVGSFSANVSLHPFGLWDSSLQFTVTEGEIYPPACTTEWKDSENEFVAGSKAIIFIHPIDAFGNAISLMASIGKPHEYEVSAVLRDGRVADVLNATSFVQEETGQIVVQFVVTTAGSLLLHVKAQNQSLRGSPLPFLVKPGSLDVSKCSANWKYETNVLQVFSLLEIFIYQQDTYGNLVTGWHSFDAHVTMKSTNLSVPVTDMTFQEVRTGVQLLSFILSEPGDFLITIFHRKSLKNISNMPYNYTVYIGYCHCSNSVVNGSGLLDSVAGQVSSFSIYLEDTYHNPSPVKLERLKVEILRKSDSYAVQPNISALLLENATGEGFEWAFVGSVAPMNITTQTSDKDRKVESSTFNVTYRTEKSGSYEIQVFCGNVPLNGGNPFELVVYPGKVDVSTSKIVKVDHAIRKQAWNAIVIQLLDSFMNPVSDQKSKLRLVDLKADPYFMSGKFEDYNYGSYIGYFMANETGSYQICILFEDQKLIPCPFKVRVYNGSHFPEVKTINISIWEGESVSFDVQTAVHFSGGNISLLEYSKPYYGTLLQWGTLFRYTPYKDFFGNDTFSFIISDMNNNLGTGHVMISVVNRPPRFSSLPVQLQAVEDVVCPTFGGFTGFELTYSNLMENISLTLRTESGSILFSSSTAQSFQPMVSFGFGLEVSFQRGEKSTEEVLLVGTVEVINSVLQSIQYLGNNNFFGTDVLYITAKNRNGIRHAKVPILVEPVNDPPYITAPKYFVLDDKESNNEKSVQIFDKNKQKFEFFIGDPDTLHFSDINQFMLALSMEVNSGTLTAKLHVGVIDTVELKLKGSNHWQPLDFFVIIKDHVVVEGKGVRFRGRIEECNNALQHLSYQGKSVGALLTIVVNDMGNYGCYPEDCNVKKTSPLFANISINIIRRSHLKPLVARSLGAAIILGFISTLFLGIMLLFFSCKCALALRRKAKSSSQVDDLHLPGAETCEGSEDSVPSESVPHFTGCSNPFPLRRYDSDFRQRSSRSFKSEGSKRHENVLDPDCLSQNDELPADLIHAMQTPMKGTGGEDDFVTQS